jgi:hypothetical protein
MRIEDRVEDVDARLKRVTAEVQGLMQMPGIYGAEYGLIRTALEGHDKRFDHLEELISDQGQVLHEHTARFDRIEEKLSDQGEELSRHGEELTRVNLELTVHRGLLEQILARVA